jgi:hypothetical protein
MASANAEQLLEIGNGEYAPDIAVAVLDRDAGTITAGVIP